VITGISQAAVPAKVFVPAAVSGGAKRGGEGLVSTVSQALLRVLRASVVN
jgi:hypothetical protein